MDGIPTGETRAVPVPHESERSVVGHGIRRLVWARCAEMRRRCAGVVVDADDPKSSELVIVVGALITPSGRCERSELLVSGPGCRAAARGIRFPSFPVGDETHLTSVE